MLIRILSLDAGQRAIDQIWSGTRLGQLGTALNLNLGNGWQAYANYDAQVNSVQTFHVGSGGVQYSW